MSRTIKSTRLSIIILMILVLMVPGNIKAVNAQTDSVSIWVGLMTPDAPGTICIGKRLVLEYYFVMLNPLSKPGKAPPLVPRSGVIVNLSAKLGTVLPPKPPHPVWQWNKTQTGTFSYTAVKEGQETITIKASMGEYSNSIDLNLVVIKCKASVNFNQKKSITQEMVVIETTYSGTGKIEADDNMQLSGDGTQNVSSQILPYSDSGGSCFQNSPWEGSSGLSFSGEISDDGNILATMFLEPLSVSSSALTCSDEDYSASMQFPGYTFDACQVQLDGIQFESLSLDVSFNCPGEEPYTLTITIFPRD